MKVLLINPNSSEGVTKNISEAAKKASLASDEIVAITAPFGPKLIITKDDSIVATSAILQILDNYKEHYDGIIIGSFGDTGIDAVRKKTSKPVVGIARSAYGVAEVLGGLFAVVTFTPSMTPSLMESIEQYGLHNNLAALLAVDQHYENPNTVQQDLHRHLFELCKEAAAIPNVRCVILGGGPLAGFAWNIKHMISCPVIDGTYAAMQMLRVAVLAQPE